MKPSLRTLLFCSILSILFGSSVRGQQSHQHYYTLPSFNQLWAEAGLLHHPFDSGLYFATGLEIGTDKSTVLIHYGDTGNLDFCRRLTYSFAPFSFNTTGIVSLPDTTLMLNIYLGLSSALVKTDLQGNMISAREIINPSVNTIYKLRYVNSGLYGVGRCFFNGKQCALLAKFDLDGNALWARAMETTNDRGTYLNDLSPTSDGGFMLTGTRYLFGGPFPDELILLRTDSAGNIIWQAQHGKPGVSFTGQTVIQTIDGGFLLRTSEGGNLPGGMMKLDSTGQVTWNKNFFDTTNQQPVLNDLIRVNDNKFIAGGMISYGNIPCPFSISIDSLGNILAARKYGGYNSFMTSNSCSFHPLKGLAIGGYEYTTNQPSLFLMHTDDQLQTQCPYTNLMMQDLNSFVTDSVAGYSSSPIPSFGSVDISAGITSDTLLLPVTDYCPLAPPIIPVSGLSSSDSVLCEKDLVDFYDLSTNNPTSWHWYFPNAIPDTSSMQHPTGIYYSTYGTYDVALVACNAAGCDSLFLPGYITVNPSPPQPVITQSNDTLFCSPASTYAWYESSNPGLILSVDSFLVVAQSGSYFVIVTDSNGCAVASGSLIFTPVEEETEGSETISVFPCPTSGEFFITGIPEGTVFSIIDVCGRVIGSGNVYSLSEPVSIQVMDGVYIVEVVLGDKVFRKKIILKN